MMKYLFLCLMMVGVANCLDYVNEYDETFTFSCPIGAFINYVYSEHDNKYEDRRFKFGCSKSYGNPSTCQWYNKLNTYDDPLDFNCPNGQYLSGIGSTHDNKYEDRRFDAYCCAIENIVPTDCQWTPYINEMDKPLVYELRSDEIMTGISSYHENKYEDRRFRFNECTNKSPY